MRALLLTALLALPLPGACAGTDPTLVALLVADESVALAQPVDSDAFAERVAATCDGCTVETYDAAGEADTQQEQVEEALAAGADVVVLDPVDTEAAEEVVGTLGEVPLVALTTLVPGADRFVGLAEPLDLGTSSLPADDLEAAREVVAGERDTLLHVPAREMSEQAAEVAVGLVADVPVEGSVEHEGVPSWLFQAREVDLASLTSVLVAEGALTLDDLCAGETARRCERLGLR